MARPVMCLRQLGVRAVISSLFLSLTFGPVPIAFGASPTPSTIATETYKVPEYTQSKLPAISTCDPKAKDDALDTIPSTGNTYMDAVTGTALKLNKAYNIKTDESTDDSSDDEEDVDGKATLDTDCDKAKEEFAVDKLGIDPEKLQCGVVNADGYLDHMLAVKTASNKFLACKRGVLDALKGEIGCFKKQIADAEGYMNELVNGQGGLAEMLKSGNDDLQKIDQEIQDRQSQYTATNDRIEGGEGGNPPGLRQMAQNMKDLASKMVNRVTQVNQAVEDLRLQQGRFNTLLNQVTIGRAMECMNTPIQGYTCVQNGTTSAKYPSGAVSPLDYLKCIYAQSANKLVGGSVIKNPKREDAMLKQANDAMALASGKTPSMTQLPDFSDPKAFNSSLKVYQVTNAADLIKMLTPTLQDMTSKAGKNFTSQFTADINRCFAAAQKEVAAERTQPNTQTMASETAMKRSFETTRAANGTAFHEIRDAYSQAVKAATGQTINIDVSKCEAASLEDQAKCFDAMRVMADSLVTGKVTPTASTLTAPALALTNGQDPIHGFTSTLEAKNNPTRTISVACAGLDDCLTKYTNYRTALKSNVEERKAFKETYKGQINNKLLNTAKELASKGTTGTGFTGVQTSPVTLNSVAAGVEQRKNQLTTLMSKFGVEAGLDLDPKEVKEPAKDENGLYKPADLKSLVLAEITPALPDNNSTGFSDATKSIGERDKELVKLQDALDTDMNALESKVAECKKDKNKLARDEAEKVCTAAREDWQKCTEGSKNDQVNQMMVLVMSKLSGENNSNITAPKTGNTNNITGSTLPTSDGSCTGLLSKKEEACGDYAKLVQNLTKGDEGTGDRKNGDSKNAGSMTKY